MNQSKKKWRVVKHVIYFVVPEFPIGHETDSYYAYEPCTNRYTLIMSERTIYSGVTPSQAYKAAREKANELNEADASGVQHE